jgi:hypothetical protein
MRIFDIQEQDIHGGSVRIFVDRGEREPGDGIVERYSAREIAQGAHDPFRLRRFAEQVRDNRARLTSLLHEVTASGKRIAGVSAPAKGMTLLNYCGIGRDTLEFVTEKSQLKIGRYTPGGHIPVVADDALLAHRPDYALLLAWNFADEIMANLRAYTEAGGRFIIPIPAPRIAGQHKEAIAA